MQMYVNYYTRELMNEGDNPPIGIVLCADKSDAIVKYSLPEDNKQIYASKYMTYIQLKMNSKKSFGLKILSSFPKSDLDHYLIIIPAKTYNKSRKACFF